jgi:sialic acid synthase SpsE
MKAGEAITINDIYLRRPGNGLSGQNIDDLCNKKLKYNLKAGHAITSLDLLND